MRDFDNGRKDLAAKLLTEDSRMHESRDAAALSGALGLRDRQQLRSDVQVFHVECMLFDKFAARLNGIAH